MSKRRSSRSAASTLRPLPDAELDVLACLVQHRSMTVSEIRERLSPLRPMAHGSVVTLLLRLMEKGLVVREKAGQGKAFLYSPVRAAESQIVRFIKEIATRVFGGNRVAMLASLLDTKQPSPHELDEMFQLLEKAAPASGRRGKPS